MDWEITIPGWVPDSKLSLNGRRRTHHMVIAKLTSQTKTTVALVLNACQITKRFGCTDPAHVIVMFVYPTNRRRDPDGLAGMVKPILDALVDAKTLTDDDCEHITLTVGAEVKKGVTATRIAVKALD